MLNGGSNWAAETPLYISLHRFSADSPSGNAILAAERQLLGASRL